MWKKINQQEENKNDFVFTKKSHLVGNVEVDHEIAWQSKRRSSPAACSTKSTDVDNTSKTVNLG